MQHCGDLTVSIWENNNQNSPSLSLCLLIAGLDRLVFLYLTDYKSLAKYMFLTELKQ